MKIMETQMSGIINWEINFPHTQDNHDQWLVLLPPKMLSRILLLLDRGFSASALNLDEYVIAYGPSCVVPDI